MIPAKAELDKQRKYKDEKLKPRLEEAKSGKRKMIYVDAAHFVLAPFLGYLWSFTRIFVKAPAGRKRFNVLGALDAITHELTIVTNETYINARTFCQLLWEISCRYGDVPITLVLDNARYQKCALVFNLARLLNIELLYLPAYSPNLNLIERLWKFVKKKCLYSNLLSAHTECHFFRFNFDCGADFSSRQETSVTVEPSLFSLFPPAFAAVPKYLFHITVELLSLFWTRGFPMHPAPRSIVQYVSIRRYRFRSFRTLGLGRFALTSIWL